MPLAGASLLDESTAAAEAMAMCVHLGDDKKKSFFVADDCHPQTIAVVQARAKAQGIDCIVGDRRRRSMFDGKLPACWCNIPTTDGRIVDYSDLIKKAHAAGVLVVMAADLLALTLIKSPGELGADIAVGSAQRFGVPLGFGGPHAGFMATKTEYARKMPGRLIGLSKDAQGNPAYRMAIQTREQHIRRDKATSNICTAQALLAIMAGMYAVYHGPHGLKKIAQRVHAVDGHCEVLLAESWIHDSSEAPFFDTIHVKPTDLAMQDSITRGSCSDSGFNLRDFGDGLDRHFLRRNHDRCEMSMRSLRRFDTGRITSTVSESVGCTVHAGEIEFRQVSPAPANISRIPSSTSYHSETEMLRYIFKLMSRDLSLAQSMIPLGSPAR